MPRDYFCHFWNFRDQNCNFLKLFIQRSNLITCEFPRTIFDFFFQINFPGTRIVKFETWGTCFAILCNFELSRVKFVISWFLGDFCWLFFKIIFPRTISDISWKFRDWFCQVCKLCTFSFVFSPFAPETYKNTIQRYL